MKLIAMAICAGTLLFSACNNGESSSTADNKGDTGKTTNKGTDAKAADKLEPVDTALANKNWGIYMTPGKEHKMMAEWSGTWTSEVTAWMDPAAPPMKSTGTSVNKMIMGGRYQQSENSGNMMGMPFQGLNIVGYDNAKKMFVSSWIDNMGSGIMNLQGPWDEATKTITFTGRAIDPTRLKEVNYRETFKVIDDNTQHMEMWGPGPDGKECKTMEIHFTRKK